MNDEKPSTKHLVLKPKEIVPTDKLARPGDGTAISVQLFHQQNMNADLKAAARKKSHTPFPQPVADEPELSPKFKATKIEKVNAPPIQGDEEAIHVDDILLENSVLEQRSGWAAYRYWKRKSKRTRDFIVGVGGMDLLIALVTYKLEDTVSFVFGLAAITLVTVMSAWIMFFVMDDY